MDYTNQMQIIYDDGMLGLAGPRFHYIFGYERAGLESLVVDGKEWLYRVPQPTFWRATTDNDRGNQFNIKSAQWLAADYVVPCVDIDLTVDDHHYDQLPIALVTNQFSNQTLAEQVEIKYTYQTVTVPQTTVTVTYLVVADGTITVRAHYQGKANLPELPVFGLRLIMPTPTTGYTYQGLSGETYPDRMAGATKGQFEVAGMPVTPYLVPQECGMHMATDWVTVTRATTLNNADPDLSPFSLKFSALDKPFEFSCLPYTSSELENATHQEELPPIHRTVMTIAGAVRGVGGIDSWGADVEPQYHLDASQDHEVSFQITL